MADYTVTVHIAHEDKDKDWDGLLELLPANPHERVTLEVFVTMPEDPDNIGTLLYSGSVIAVGPEGHRESETGKLKICCSERLRERSMPPKKKTAP